MKHAIPPRIGLDSLMLVIALFAFCSAVVRAAAPLGVPLALIAAVALARAVRQIGRRQAEGGRLTTPDKVTAYAATFGSTLNFITPGFLSLALVMACFSGGGMPPYWVMPIAWAAALGSSYAGYRLARRAIREEDL